MYGSGKTGLDGTSVAGATGAKIESVVVIKPEPGGSALGVGEVEASAVLRVGVTTALGAVTLLALAVVLMVVFTAGVGDAVAVVADAVAIVVALADATGV